MIYTMKIILNNRPEVVNRDTVSLSELIELKNFSFRLLVTRVNGTLVRKENRDDVIIHEGDNVKIHHMISGG